MSLVAFKASNHPQQLGVRGVADDIDDRAVPWEWFREMDAQFGPFTLDAAASSTNAKCARYFTSADNGLQQSWAGERVYCNPPFSNLAAWVAKAHAEQYHALGILMVLPASRTEQGWWHQYVEPYRDRPDTGLRSHFLQKRRAFLKPGDTVVPPNSRPPFGIVLLHWTGRPQ